MQGRHFQQRNYTGGKPTKTALLKNLSSPKIISSVFKLHPFPETWKVQNITSLIQGTESNFTTFTAGTGSVGAGAVGSSNPNVLVLPFERSPRDAPESFAPRWWFNEKTPLSSFFKLSLIQLWKKDCSPIWENLWNILRILLVCRLWIWRLPSKTNNKKWGWRDCLVF